MSVVVRAIFLNEPETPTKDTEENECSTSKLLETNEMKQIIWKEDEKMWIIILKIPDSGKERLATTQFP